MFGFWFLVYFGQKLTLATNFLEIDEFNRFFRKTFWIVNLARRIGYDEAERKSKRIGPELIKLS